MTLKRNLKIVWDEATGPDAKRRRYLARALNGGPGWGVYDQKRDEFLKDRQVASLSPEQLREVWAS